MQTFDMERDESPARQRLARFPAKQGLYDPLNERDACGVGFLVNIEGGKSHRIIEQGITVLKNLLHRGATGADPETGDGVGLLFQLPDAFFRRACAAQGMALPSEGQYGAGMFFLPRDPEVRARCMRAAEKAVTGEGLRFLGWREVPVNPSVLGRKALEEMPFISQCFVSGAFGDELERKLYVVRKQCENLARPLTGDSGLFYVPSFSSRTIVYKGLMLPKQIAAFYPDLNDEALVSALAVVHQRYSTNTFPSWALAQPFRYLAHNGEINTLRGNRNWMASRENNLSSDFLGEDIRKITPVIEPGGSDSAALDNVLELLYQAGRPLDQSVAMMIPQAWGAKYPIGPDLRGFYEYHSGLMEPWDGPASVAFTDGRFIGAVLDRNGLRPARYTLTRDGFMVFASEAGVLDIAPGDVKEKGSLRPGEMIMADVQTGRLMKNVEIKQRLARRQPYRRWVDENRIDIHGFFSAVNPVSADEQKLKYREKLFGYTREDLNVILAPMAAGGHEPVGSMGSDQPLAVLSEKPQLLYWYFKQSFAQVTNPPIDPYREELVMSLMTFLGNTDDILRESPQHARLVKLQHPILSNEDLQRIRELPHEDFRSATLAMEFPARGRGRDLEDALESLCRQAETAVRSGSRIIILSDRSISENHMPVPALLATAAVNRHLIGKGLRTRTGLLVETGEAREVMHLALLLGYGASAVNLYLACEIIADLAVKKQLPVNLPVARAMKNYFVALQKGLLKIMSKMGISTLRSYRNAQVFEAVGLNSDVIRRYFEGTPSRVEGIGLDGIAREARARCEAAQRQPAAGDLLASGGQYSFRKDGERHLWTPETITLLQQAARENNPEKYRRYAELINDQSQRQSTLRGLLRFRPVEPVPLDEVEPVEEIMKRFVTGAMSFGSISREAHETLAIAMNRIGGKSNSGEGGEDEARYRPLPNGDSRCSAIKQIASGRFGVTAEYLVNARELQIKIAQGAKPGEGGQLPGHKVNAEIARVRHSTPGVTLISPPPHHDIYSIEDIAQLIYDLHCANREARVSVKLVSETGVGTVAAGVAKAKADMILISGYDGGTGASPLSSIKHAGMSWELGLSEAQQTLVLNNLRSRVRLQVDGQLKTGRDVVIGALLGAEEFGFATAPLVVCGCLMMRDCHLNTCPVGVATQDPRLRKCFRGKPEHVVNFMRLIAGEVREHMAQLGVRKMDDLVGRTDLLEMNPAVEFWKAKGVDLSRILYRVPAEADGVRCTQKQEHGVEDALDLQILDKVRPSIETGAKVELSMPIRNCQRTAGAMISSEIARRCGHKGLGDDTITLRFTGSAGQSFGAFASRGMTMILEGEANDYAGKGLSGAKIIIRPPAGSAFAPSESIIAGNVLLYGATAGEMYLNGRAGERFCIRNSGAHAVVEGVGDHGCEYMTGGRVVILGPVGVNFGAGMSGGIAYVYDGLGTFDENCNLDMIDLESVSTEDDECELRGMIEKHLHYTGSPRAAEILANWELSRALFVKVFPMEYKKALGRLSREDEQTERAEVVND
ncbi:MAG: glutamate synthase large subunit [Kiritimatiellia bacterium]